MKVKIGKYIIPITLTKETDAKLKLKFPYQPDLIEEIKNMQGARWHPEGKYWTITDCDRNWFQFLYLQHAANPDEYTDPYAPYDRELIEWQSDSGRSLFSHQILGVQQILTRKRTILAYDTGIGKTLIAIEAMEYLEKQLGRQLRIVWVGPKSALVAVKYEFNKWRTSLEPVWLTYDGLKKYCEQAGTMAERWLEPDIVIYDEAQKIKNPTSQRSQAATWLADKIRNKNGYIVLMSGTPAPHSPLDWWHLCECACAGFLKEGDIKKFQKRLGCVKWEENNVTGGMYPKLITWFNDPLKCAICGRMKDDFAHDPINIVMGGENHIFKPSKDEVSYLYQRMKGLVLVKLKKDVLKELPDKNYRVIEVEPSASILRMAKLITKTSRSTIEALTLLRELSDGFQYKDEESTQSEVCKLCHGSKVISGTIVGSEESKYVTCTLCKGMGTTSKSERKTIEIACPKDGVIRDLLEEYEDVGRIVLYANFTAAVDRLVKLVKKEGWHYIRVDGRGWDSDIGTNSQELYKVFQEETDLIPKVAYIGNPESGGIGLTLTASPVEIYFDNGWNWEHREQSENRGHRPGMDLNKGLTIIDIIHLESDRKVMENHRKKKDLQSMTLGEIVDCMEQSEGTKRYY